MPWLGPAAVIAGVALHLKFLARERRREISTIVLGVLLGAVIDSLFAAAHVVKYQCALAPNLAPPWILALWAAFATTFAHGLSWLRGRPWLAMLAGALAGPPSYLAGESLGALTVLEPRWVSFPAVAAGFALAVPLLAGARTPRPERDH